MLKIDRLSNRKDPTRDQEIIYLIDEHRNKKHVESYDAMALSITLRM